MRGTSVLVVALACASCSPPAGEQGTQAGPPAAATDTMSLPHPTNSGPATVDSEAIGPLAALPPNELGRIPVLEYHLIGAETSRWMVTPEQFRADLELLWDRGYRPVSLRELLDGSFQLPAGLSPVVITFDDASPGQFRYLERGAELEIDPASALGVWLEFARTHPGWRNRAVFCVLSGAEAGRSFFGDRGIEGQKTEWRQRKIAFLVEQGFELCNHTVWHGRLSGLDDARVQEQIARLQLAVDSASPGYRIRSLALPLGVWPKNRALAQAGSWTDPRSGRRIDYQHDVVLLVAGGPTRSPYDPEFNPLAITRLQAQGDDPRQTLDGLDRSGTRYVSDGDPHRVAGRGGDS